MPTEFYQPSSNAYFSLKENDGYQTVRDVERPKLLKIFINLSENEIPLMIDGELIKLGKNQVTTGTFIQKIDLPKFRKGLTVLSFNREFYCLETHEAEVSCNGIIFFGAKQVPVITIPEESLVIFNSLIGVFQEELLIKDANQEKMLQMLLKRLIILITRFAKTQLHLSKEEPHHVELIRNFYSLVDVNYRILHSVADYANLLHKSPKTLSNVFARYGLQAPISIIHERLMMEARYLLNTSTLSIKEIINVLGFQNSNTFYKLFRKLHGCSPQDYREKEIGKKFTNEGKNDYLLLMEEGVKTAYKQT